MRFVTAFLILFMISIPSGAKCSCGGGASAGFNFLGDYVRITPDGKAIRGSASGGSDSKVVIVIGKDIRPV